MKQTQRQATRPSTRTFIVALLMGFAVLLLLFPVSGVSTFPPQCYGILFYPVPCDPWVAPLAGIATAGVLGWVLWRSDRRQD